MIGLATLSPSWREVERKVYAARWYDVSLCVQTPSWDGGVWLPHPQASGT